MNFCLNAVNAIQFENPTTIKGRGVFVLANYLNLIAPIWTKLWVLLWVHTALEGFQMAILNVTLLF